MKQVLKYVGYFVLIAIVGFFIWRFWFMITWILMAAILSFIGRPVVRFFDGLHVKKWKIPHAVSTLLTLLVIVLTGLGILAIFVPLILEQAQTIGQIDVGRLADNLQGALQWIEDQLQGFGVIPESQTIEDFIVLKVKSVVNFNSVTSTATKLVSSAGSFFVGLFSILFIAFFFLKDEGLFENTLHLLVPVKHHNATSKVISESKNLLMRYFTGVILEVAGVMAIITIFLWILGVDNALLIGFFGGMMNIIPYLGPVIGSAIGITLGLTATLATGSYSDLFPVLIKLVSVFAGANFIDNNFLVPMIYSSSVKAHPLEIFFIIIMGGSLAGILGMLLAVPVYTVLRVIAKEFFQQYRIVRKLTEKIDIGT
jgi:predicted PurR-regulated permease PerM